MSFGKKSGPRVTVGWDVDRDIQIRDPGDRIDPHHPIIVHIRMNEATVVRLNAIIKLLKEQGMSSITASKVIRNLIDDVMMSNIDPKDFGG